MRSTRRRPLPERDFYNHSKTRQSGERDREAAEYVDPGTVLNSKDGDLTWT